MHLHTRESWARRHLSSTSVRRASATALAGLTVVLSGAVPAAAQSGASPPETPAGTDPALPTQSQRAPEPELRREIPRGRMDEAKWRALENKVGADGVLPVIVGLSLPTRPDGAMAADERRGQRRNIAAKRDATVAELRGTRFTNLRTTEIVPFVALHATRETLRALKRSRRVATVVEDEKITVDDSALRTPASTSSNENLTNWWDHYLTDTDDSWAKGYDGRGQTIAIVDTGVQRDHTWLSNAVVNEACFATYVNGNGAGACPNGRWTQLGLGAARPCTFHAVCAHGTHVAGIAAGTQGVASKAKVMAIQVFQRGANGSPTYMASDLLWAMDHVYKNRGAYSIAAVNMSLGDNQSYGSPCDDRANASGFYAWIAALRSVGIATTVASMNNGYTNGISHPACMSNAVSVGNTTLDANGYEAVNATSNQNAYVSLLAPGTKICSSVPTTLYECWTGTSMAAPQVAGAFAALKQLRPTTSVTASLTALQASGVGVGDYFGRAKTRINVWKAINYLYTH